MEIKLRIENPLKVSLSSYVSYSLLNAKSESRSIGGEISCSRLFCRAQYYVTDRLELYDKKVDAKVNEVR